MKSLIPALTLTLGLLPAAAHAQWQFSMDAGARYVRMTEYDTDGSRLVRETGWLPGFGAGAAYQFEAWRFGVEAEWYGGVITYDGQLQNGAPFDSSSDTSQRRLRLEVGRQINESLQFVAGLEQDVWRRGVRGRGNVIGIHERYQSLRVLAGLKAGAMDTAAGAVDVKGLLVLSEPEHMRIRFGQRLFDSTRLTTEPALGIRLGLGFRPAAVSGLALEAEFDWIRIGRSGDGPLYRAGMPVGTVTQPEHERASVSLRARYSF